MKILFVDTYYPEFLNGLYASDAALAGLEFEDQLRRIYQSAFGVGDAYGRELRNLGCDAREVICNADIVQAKWAARHGLRLVENLHDRRRQVLASQIDAFRPDVLYVFEWSPLGDAFLAEMKPRVRRLVGQIASPLPANRTFVAYDFMVSSYPPIVDYFRGAGIDAEPLKLAFDRRILEGRSAQPPLRDVTFVGGFAACHVNRVAWLERVLKDIPVDIFGYGLERVPQGSPIHRHYRGPAWGWRMYEVLQRSRLTLNLHATIDVRGQVATNAANNMRLYEATGVGTCLVTEQKDNLRDMFEPADEVVAYEGAEDCAAKVRYYLDHEAERAAIAAAGQQRTLRDHTYAVRMRELLEMLQRRL
jgi:hypothetical protein